MFGIGMLLPNNAIFAAMDYFTSSFPDYSPQFSLLVAVSVPMLLVQAVCYFLLGNMPLQFRMTWTFGINTLVTLGLVLAPLIISDQAVAYWIVIFLSVVFGSAVAVL